jgi:hypothetical protein
VPGSTSAATCGSSHLFRALKGVAPPPSPVMPFNSRLKDTLVINHMLIALPRQPQNSPYIHSCMYTRQMLERVRPSETRISSLHTPCRSILPCECWGWIQLAIVAYLFPLQVLLLRRRDSNEIRNPGTLISKIWSRAYLFDHRRYIGSRQPMATVCRVSAPCLLEGDCAIMASGVCRKDLCVNLFPCFRFASRPTSMVRPRISEE